MTAGEKENVLLKARGTAAQSALANNDTTTSNKKAAAYTSHEMCRLMRGPLMRDAIAHRYSHPDKVALTEHRSHLKITDLEHEATWATVCIKS
jgi:hypothetical protein